MRKLDLKNKRFGRLVAIDSKNRGQKVFWKCRCDCGAVHFVQTCKLTGGEVRSCGCYRRDVTSANFKTHGLSKTWKIRTLGMIKSRCTNPNDKRYKNYGGRGIGFDPRWNDAMKFLSDINKLGPRPKGYTLDRKNNNKGYFISNLRWADCHTQARNTRSNRMISFNGKTKCMAEWAESLGMRNGTLWARFDIGWSIKRALTTPLRAMMPKGGRD